MSSAGMTPRISNFLWVFAFIQTWKKAFRRSSKFYSQHLEWSVSVSHLKLWRKIAQIKGLFKQLYMLLLYNWLNQNTELILSFFHEALHFAIFHLPNSSPYIKQKHIREAKVSQSRVQRLSKVIRALLVFACFHNGGCCKEIWEVIYVFI